MTQMLHDTALRGEVADILHAYGLKTRWDVVGGQHLRAFGLHS